MLMEVGCWKWAGQPEDAVSFLLIVTVTQPILVHIGFGLPSFVYTQPAAAASFHCSER